MKKIITSAVLLLAAGLVSNAQTNATDFTATDCNGTNHTLFQELDNGKIVVLTWVMPCSACENPATAAYNAVQSFATSHPGQVVYFVADDYGDSDCSTLNNWITSSGIGNASLITLFENTGNVIDMGDYGSPGMPKVVVMGGTDHKIFFNKNNSAANDQPGITNAISSALTTTGIAEAKKGLSFSMAPNPANGSFVINYKRLISKVVIITPGGQTVHEEVFTGGKANPVVRMPGISAGMYLVRITDIDGNTGMQQLINR